MIKLTYLKKTHKIIISNESSCLILISYEDDNNLYNSSDILEFSKDTDLEIEISDYINKDTFEKDYDIFE